jgi:hypothetical protein
MPFYLLVLVTLPLSLTAWSMTYLGGVLVFGPGEWGVIPRLLVATMWVAVAVVEATFVCALLQARRART